MTGKNLRKFMQDGWIIEHGSKHLKLRQPNRRDFITVARTPKDYRAVKNIQAMMRRYLRDQ
jgi:hypothetical protein